MLKFLENMEAGPNKDYNESEGKCYKTRVWTDFR